ncbi:unnamed protein product [Lymnaea stagnalis]|uniref:Uncharacterized protein n=1 Tax=Lymnaea stagnalis TaxID=6523 RepID=A0AAV2ICA2_LYMST
MSDGIALAPFRPNIWNRLLQVIRKCKDRFAALLCKIVNTRRIEFEVSALKESTEVMECDKRKDHNKFIPAHSFKIDDLPKEHRSKDLHTLIILMAKLTGRIEVDVDSNNFKHGTGFIQRTRLQRGQCPCHECQGRSGQKVFAVLTVTTVVHVFPNTRENNQFKINGKPEDFTMLLNYNTEPVNERDTIYGWHLLETDKDINERMDWCCIEFVTHNLTLANEIKTNLTQYQEMQLKVYDKAVKDKKLLKKDVDLVVVVGHPHGGIKKVSVGRKVGEPDPLKELRDTQRWGCYKYDTPTCPGSSGSPILILGQPISGFGYWFGHPHNHSGNDKHGFNISSIGVDFVVDDENHRDPTGSLSPAHCSVL